MDTNDDQISVQLTSVKVLDYYSDSAGHELNSHQDSCRVITLRKLFSL